MQIPRMMIAAPASGSGKTTITCGIMAALQKRNLRVAACKCGPDYIDPMFHREVLGIASENLDLFFCEPEVLRGLFLRHASAADITVAEGVMGYYDGLSLESAAASSYDVAGTLDIPVILVVPCKGMALSVVPAILGMLEFQEDSHIRGIVLNQISGMLYPRMKQMIEDELRKRGYSVPVVGYVPEQELFHLESRHLGLVMPDEIADLRERLCRIGDILSETIDMDLLLKIAADAPDIADVETGGAADAPDIADVETGGVADVPDIAGVETGIAASNRLPESCACGLEKVPGARVQEKATEKVRIAVAQDEAFCFYYQDNMALLRDLGCELVPFSPLHDTSLPEAVQGLLLGGGYPELYAEQLSANQAMRRKIGAAIRNGLPCIAECGGFLYLHEMMEGKDGKQYPMAGVIRGNAFRTERLGRFGYIHLRAEKDSAYLRRGEALRGHEFHYWDSTANGQDCLAVKPDGKRSWKCVHMEGNLFAGFPHLHFYSNPGFTERFVEICRGERTEK